MKKISFNMSKDVCDDCSLALRRFIGNMKGVESINVEEGKVVIDFTTKISKKSWTGCWDSIENWDTS
jgi:hypothetical protein